MSGTGLILDPVFKTHDTGPHHPERPARIDAIIEALTTAGLVDRCVRLAAAAADPEELLANHDRAYLERLHRYCVAGESHIDCADSAICPRSYDIALLAAGGVLDATERVASGELTNAFCAVRPPGHHAERHVSMGFCLFNNVAVAARRLLDRHGVERVLIFDFDVHHGNGTQHSFEEDPRVFFCSVHGHPATLYPGTGYAEERGRGAGEGTTLNLPMMPGSGDAEYRAAYEEQFAPAAKAFQPQFILISAGFDAHRRDPLGNVRLESSSFEWLTRRTLELADDLCGGRVVSVLEGGYDLSALGECTCAHVGELPAAAGRA
ncbi:MAG: histone deacetylase [Phycisphaerales bacterium]|nr:MAG: histone deacetylase [Phycisphaerales bacterium]